MKSGFLCLLIEVCLLAGGDEYLFLQEFCVFGSLFHLPKLSLGRRLRECFACMIGHEEPGLRLLFGREIVPEVARRMLCRF